MTAAPDAPPEVDLSARVAEEIRAMMGRRNISGRKLAIALQVRPMWVSERLRGITPIDLNDLDRIAKVLRCPVLALFPAVLRTDRELETYRFPTHPMALPTPGDPAARMRRPARLSPPIAA